MEKQFAGLVAVFALTCATCLLNAQSDKKSATPTVAGSWTMSVETPHGATTMGLTLKQEGKKVAGTFSSPHGDNSVEGEFADGTLTLATTGTDDRSPDVTFSAKLRDNGTLTGDLSSQMGDMPWTATRVKQ
jgi:hypothetical protein